MFNRKITMQEWADIHDAMSVTDRQIAGSALITTGAHHRMGAVIAIQADDGMHILTENPLVLPEEDDEPVYEGEPVNFWANFAAFCEAEGIERIHKPTA